MNSPVWFVTGASRGLGLEIARAALARGFAVVAGARDPQAVVREFGQKDRLLAVALDVTVEEQVRDAVALGLDRFGRVDVLVNNAGRGLLGAVEEASAQDVRSVIAGNVEGLLAVTRAVLPSMRARRSGRIVNISSVGGFTASAGWGVYCATKFAVEGLSEALHAELRPLGIQVVIVEPGAFRTNFLDDSSLAKVPRAIEDYIRTAGVTRQWAQDTNHAQNGDPVKAAAAILSVATSAEPPLRLQLGADSVNRVARKLADVSAEMAAWKYVALSTAFRQPSAVPGNWIQQKQTSPV